jgi:hypothetical protein
MSELDSALPLGPGIDVMSEWLAIRRRVQHLVRSMATWQFAAALGRQPRSPHVPGEFGLERLPYVRVAEEWICVFNGRAGGHARAVFESKDHATRFAEQHARAVGPGMPLKWEDSNEATLLLTQLGDYLVAPSPRARSHPHRAAVRGAPPNS